MKTVIGVLLVICGSAAADGNTLNVADTLYGGLGTNAVPVYVSVAQPCDTYATAFSFSLYVDTAVITPEYPYFVARLSDDEPDLLSLWYGKTCAAQYTDPAFGLVRVAVFGVNKLELTTFDDQRIGGTPTDQQNPFTLGYLLYSGEPGYIGVTPVLLGDVALAAADGTRIEHVTLSDGSVMFKTNQVGVSGLESVLVGLLFACACLVGLDG